MGIHTVYHFGIRFEDLRTLRQICVSREKAGLGTSPVKGLEMVFGPGGSKCGPARQ